jgi:lysozyme
MKTSVKGVALIKAHEGLRLRAYLCPANVWTIGYGHTTAAGHPTVKAGDVITATEADTILRRDLSRFEEGVLDLVRVPLTQGQFDALVSFAFNCGLGALGKSTLLKRVNARRFSEVPAEFMKWTKGGGRELPGLVRRRREETALWRDVSGTATAGKADVAAVDPPAPPKGMAQSKTGNASIIAGAGGVVATGKAIVDVAKEAQTAATDATGILMAVGPWVIVAVVVVAACGFIWWDRRRKMQEHGI